MFMIVVLRLKNNINKTVWIPAHWCVGFSMRSVFSRGMLRTEDLTVFYSKNKKKVPNFTLMIRDEFVEEDSCYIARFKTCIGNFVNILSRRASIIKHFHEFECRHGF